MLEKFKASAAFGQAKLADILFAKEFTQRFPEGKVTVNCFHPGVMYNDPDAGITYKLSHNYESQICMVFGEPKRKSFLLLEYVM